MPDLADLAMSWRVEELARLKRLRDDGASIRFIASKLRRTQKAVEDQLKK
jgi:Ribonuclease G/E